VVPRSSTIFLLFGIVLLFGLLLIFPFKALVLGGAVYLLTVPISLFHYNKIKKTHKHDNSPDDEEPEDVL